MIHTIQVNVLVHIVICVLMCVLICRAQWASAVDFDDKNEKDGLYVPYVSL
jgi:hypothetical protein